MSNNKPETRQRLVSSAADMISRRGLDATSIRELAKYAKVPLGSTYHYFPGGKQQVAVEAIQYAGDNVAHLLQQALEAGPIAGLHSFLDLWRSRVKQSHFQAGCPVLAVATEEPTDEVGLATLEAASEVFSKWRSLLAESLIKHGAEKAQANSIATLAVASVEGSVALCRAHRSLQPLDEIEQLLDELMRQAISQQ
ncbi:TetR/AcrR family transcriptional regulator [Marinomonas communis]|uniref:TetR/AcrR family transcriptional regulator n=1 Tax=Marinomonas communis TaxID=28254 RepID=UPI001D18A1BB|nr:TetR family transcriptional regulator [Marinomonas communis]MCC4273846.1 TetR family transcriptional regulator [Marinomonas communis]